MRYYVCSDVHSFYSILHEGLTQLGFFTDQKPHRLLVLGDIMDRGPEALKMQSFILDLMEKDQVTLVRGNHEDLFLRLLDKDRGLPVRPHVGNGTYDTLLQLTGYDKMPQKALEEHETMVCIARKTPFFTTIIPNTVNYFETRHYVFIHGWIPCIMDPEDPRHKVSAYMENWRNADMQAWYRARWINGMSAYQVVTEPGKTIVCGHYHTSWGHCHIENNGPEEGPDADFSPFRDTGILAIDACTADSGRMNIEIIED